MLHGFADAVEVSYDTLNSQGRPESFSVEPSQEMFELMITTFPAEEVLSTE